MAVTITLLKFATTVAALVILSSVSSAVPVPGFVELSPSQVFLERGVTPLVSRAEGAACHDISAEEFEKFSGWAKIAKYAEDNWGTSGGRHITNPSEYPDYLLQGCTKGSIVPVTYSGTPECSESKAQIKGTSVGAATGLSFEVKSGYTQSASWSVTQSSSLTVGAKFSISVGVKALGGDVSAETYLDTTITNERSSSFESSVNREETFGMTLENKDGEQCRVEQVSQICRATGKGDAPIIAQGFFWFFFHESREMKDHPEYGSHYHWVVNIADVLTEEERTSHISFQGPVNTESAHAYMNNCLPIG